MQPLLYAAVAAAMGIAAAGAGPAWLGPLGWVGVWGALAAGTVAAAVLPGRRRWAAALGLAFCLSAGYARTRSVMAHPAAPSALARHVAQIEATPRDRVFLTGYLRDTPELLYDAGGGASALRLDLAVTSIARGPQATPWPASGGVRLYAYPPRAAAAPGDDDAPDPAPPPEDDAWAAPLLRLPAGQGLAVTAHLRPLQTYHDPGVADFAAADRRQGIAFSATLPAGGWQPWPVVAAPRTTALRARVWGWLSRRLDRLAPPARQPRLNGLLRGMLLGDTARLDGATRTAFQADGVYHLLVVAGLHIGVLAWLLLWLFRLGRLPRAPAGLVTLLLLAAYAWVIAGRTPTLRALFMLALYFVATLWYRERQALNAVGFAGLALLAWHPLDLFDAGFQMSLGAAALLAGVALPLLARSTRPLLRACRQLDNVGLDEAFTPRLAQFRLDLRALATRLGWFWRPLGWRGMPLALRALLHVAEVAAISLVLQLGFAGFNAVYFHRANPWSVVANGLLVPAAGLLIPLAWLGLAAGAWTHAPVAWLGDGMLRVADALARWPGAQWRVPSPPGWFLALFGLAVAAWIAVWIWRPQPRAVAVVSAAVAGLALVLSICPFPTRLPPGLSATVLDVGQGDSIFVAFPDGRTLLVDGGPRSARWDSGEEIVAPFLWSLGLHRIDAILLTHGHNDHLGGLSTVVANFHPEEVWVTRTLPTEAPVVAFLRQVAASGARLRRLSAGDAFRAGAIRLQVLLPPPGYQAGEIASNDDSMVVRLSWGADAMLLEGDAEAGGERWMVDQHLTLASPLLKVGHHGSRTSSTPAFLAAVAPRVAVISVGAGNSYGHPAPDVVARLRQAGAQVFRTDQDGAVQCRLSPTQLAVYLFARVPARAELPVPR